MSGPLRILLLGSDQADADWRSSFDLLQAAAALDVPVEIGVSGPALRWLLPEPAVSCDIARAFSSLALLDLAPIRARRPCPDALAGRQPILPLDWMDAPAWRIWLRHAALQVW
ncbi:MAG: hypothetical protein AB7E72_10165 [Lysobacterales bacterium]